MGWGAPLGFSSGRTPFEMANTASYGEPGWYFRLTPKPTTTHPLRAILGTPCARAAFTDENDAALYLNHPGEIPLLARKYLAWLAGGETEGQR